MPVISRQKDGVAAIVENTENPLSEGAGNKARGRISAPAMQNTPSLPRIRNRKVLAVRQQLGEGIYDLDERENAILDLLFAAVTT
jgi:hypothetical protein